MTDKAQKIYDEADGMFDEYNSGSLECDMLDFLWDLLQILPDNFLDRFEISYNTDTEECDDEEIFEAFGINKIYEYPQVFFNMAHTFADIPINADGDEETNRPYFEIDSCGYRLKDGTYFGCTPNHDNTSVAKEFYEEFCSRYNLQF